MGIRNNSRKTQLGNPPLGVEVGAVEVEPGTRRVRQRPNPKVDLVPARVPGRKDQNSLASSNQIRVRDRVRIQVQDLGLLESRYRRHGQGRAHHWKPDRLDLYLLMEIPGPEPKGV